MPTATSNGLTLYTERAGAGPPLLFISGAGGDVRNKANAHHPGPHSGAGRG
jgi:3-oxoadipate enol-lactonase